MKMYALVSFKKNTQTAYDSIMVVRDKKEISSNLASYNKMG